MHEIKFTNPYNTCLLQAPPEYRSKIIGQKQGSMFGSAIISLGDLNGDKKDGRFFFC